MNLYLSNGRAWTGTQKDAKDAGPFVAVDVPTDKPGLLRWLNENWIGRGEPTVSPDGEETTGSRDEESHRRTEPEDGLTPVTSQPAANPTDCPACHRSPRVAQIVVNCEASMTAQAAIADVTDTRSLDRIIAVAVARRAEL